METVTQFANPNASDNFHDLFSGNASEVKEDVNIALMKAILDEMNEILQSEEFSSEEKIAAIEKAQKEIEEKVDLYYSDSMLALRNEYLRVKDNDGFYSKSIKNLFEDGFFMLELDYYSAVKDELTKVLDFLKNERIMIGSRVDLNCSDIDFDCSEIFIDIESDDNFRFAHTPYRLKSFKDLLFPDTSINPTIRFDS